MLAVCPNNPEHRFEPVMNVNRFMGPIYDGGDVIVCPFCTKERGVKNYVRTGKFFNYRATLESPKRPDGQVAGKGVQLNPSSGPAPNPYLQQGPTAFASQKVGKFTRRSILGLMQELSE